MYVRLLCHRITNNSSQMFSFYRSFSQTIATSKSSLTAGMSFFNRSSPCFSPALLSNIKNFTLRRSLGCGIFKRSKATIAKHSQTTTRHVFDVNTNVTNNVFLYKYEKMRYFRFMNGFGVFQLIFWLGICYLEYSQLPVRDSDKIGLLKYLEDNFLNVSVSVVAFLAGVGSALLIWVFTAKSVKYLILNKGGRTATFVTYHPLNNHVSITVPIDNIKCRTARTQMKNFLPLKLQGRSFYYMLDSSGNFVNPTLFDHTVGATRS